MGRHQPVRSGADEVGQPGAALLVALADHVSAVDRQDVEQVERGLRLVALDQLEPRPALGVEHDQLAVEDRPLGLHAVGQRRQLGVLVRDVVGVRALQPHPPVVDERQRAVAVPLDLVGPPGVVVGQRARARPSSARRGTTAPRRQDVSRRAAVRRVRLDRMPSASSRSIASSSTPCQEGASSPAAGGSIWPLPAVIPPSTGTITPFTNEAAGEARKTITSATSIGVPQWPARERVGSRPPWRRRRAIGRPRHRARSPTQ